MRRGLPDHRVAAHERDGVDPHRDHGREVEGRDGRRDAERLPKRAGVHVGGHVRRIETRQLRGQPARELDGLETPDYLTEGVGVGLAVIARDEPRHLLAVSPDQLAEGEEDLAPGQERRIAPGREGPVCGTDGGVDLRDSTARHTRDDLAGRRVEHRAGLLREHLHRSTVDPVADDRNGGRCCGRRLLPAGHVADHRDLLLLAPRSSCPAGAALADRVRPTSSTHASAAGPGGEPGAVAAQGGADLADCVTEP